MRKNKKIIQKAISYIKILKSTASYSFLELKPITGRKHQLRKQLYNIGNPIVGDDKYFIKKSLNYEKMKNLMLHAYQIKFMINGIKYNFQADINNNFKDFLKKKKIKYFLIFLKIFFLNYALYLIFFFVFQIQQT